MGNIYTVLFYKKDGKVIAAQETFETWDDAIGDIVTYGYTPHAVLELEENGKTQSYTDDALESAIGQFKGE